MDSIRLLCCRLNRTSTSSMSVLSTWYIIRRLSSRLRPDRSSYLFQPNKAEILDEVDESLGTTVKRHHPGVMAVHVQRVERDIQQSIGRVLVSSGLADKCKADARKVDRQLRNRRLPPEMHDVLKLRQDIEKRFRNKEAKEGRAPEYFETDEDRKEFEEEVQRQCEKRLKTSIYPWRSMQFDSKFKCLTYCLVRFAPEYAVLRRVFHEMAKREPNFHPSHIFDFGSGLGTTFFASEATWNQKPVEEYVCVDSSEEMVSLFQSLIRNGEETGQPRHRNVNIRAFLPATVERQFDVVVSAYSLFESSSYQDRMNIVTNLWMKTKHFLVLVENGTNAGFRAIVEARDYILASGHEIHRRSLEEMASRYNVNITDVELVLARTDMTESEKFRLLRQKYPAVDFPTLLPHGHVFAPCPHDMGCPRLMDVTPCVFGLKYFPMRISRGEEKPQTEQFSYVILRKGYAPEPTDRWPRIVREPRKSKSCIWCQTCSPHGILEDQPFHKGPAHTERGRLFRLAKYSEWGDLLPVTTSYSDKKEESDGDEGKDGESDQ